MFEYTCTVCGKVKQALRRRDVRLTCSKECTAKARELKKQITHLQSTGGSCVHNRNVNCNFLECENCGWNPEVAEDRLNAIVEKMNECTV